MDSAWRSILEYFSSATHVGLTATPKETKEVSNIDYFGEPVYTYSLRQGIEDGFLAPYKVVRVDIDRDLQGWRPSKGQRDTLGQEIEDRIYNQKDFDRQLVIEPLTELVARKITEFLEGSDPYQKTIVFCEDIDHAERMRQALVNMNPKRVAENRKYVMRITGDEAEGKAELDNFINPEARYPVIATTSKLMTTGVDAQTCKLIVLDQRIQSMTEFKQIIGRGTRINDDYHKHWFTILDFDKDGFKNESIVRHKYEEPLAGFELKANNILMAMTGGTVGKSYLVKSLPEPMVVDQRVATIKIAPDIRPEYIYSLISTKTIRNVIEKAKNSTNDNISMKDIKNFPIPVPPIEEQHRIVEKVDELMALCDHLKARLGEAGQTRTHLAEAVVEKATS